ncbi:MAG: HAMP domain-containing histidine kinase [Candidatus Brocadiaceae bacterium]|nr:HAMP domain-containing histidine kinase [Candidatus Brocadiaceae bacterium]
MKRVIPFSFLFLLALYQQIWAVDSYDTSLLDPRSDILCTSFASCTKTDFGDIGLGFKGHNANKKRQTMLNRVEQAWPVTRVSKELAWPPINFLDKVRNPDGTLAIVPGDWMTTNALYKHGLDYSILWKVLPAIFIVFAVVNYWKRSFAQFKRQLAISCDMKESARREAQKAKIEVELAYEQQKELDNLKSVFMSSISHELRTPLNSIIGFSNLLLNGVSGELTVQQKDSIERIYRNGKHLHGLISDVIDTYKIESGSIGIFSEQFTLKELVEEAIGIIRPQADTKGLELNVQSAIWPEMYTDRKRLLQCLLNYLSNGVKYTEIGHVTLYISSVENEVHIVVTDTSIGISEVDIPKLFKAFVRIETHMRLKPSGVGLGLYLTKRIATDLLKGSVAVESKLGMGSSFGLQIPTHVAVEKSIAEENILGGSRASLNVL